MKREPSPTPIGKLPKLDFTKLPAHRQQMIHQVFQELVDAKDPPEAKGSVRSATDEQPVPKQRAKSGKKGSGQ